MLTDQDLDQRARAAASELSDAVGGTPPDLAPVIRRSRARRRVGSGVVIVVAVLALAVPLLSRGGGSSKVVSGADGPRPSSTTTIPPPSSVNADLLEPGASRPLAPSPLEGRSTMAAVWTGSAMVIWGGDSEDGQFADGASYDPRADRWTMLPAAPLSPRNQPAAVWTGSEVLLWGGSSSAGSHRDGAAYDPATRRWRPIADAPFTSEGRPIGLWTGSEMIVFAGVNSSAVGAYDPKTDSWRALPELPTHLQPPDTSAAWDGVRLVTVVQAPGGVGRARLVALEPGAERWTDLGPLDGQTTVGGSNGRVVIASGNHASVLIDGTRSPIGVAPDGAVTGDRAGVWTGAQLVLWTGDGASVVDPTRDTWRAVPPGPGGHRTQPALVWADGIVLAWGGFPDVDTGIALRPG